MSGPGRIDLDAVRRALEREGGRTRPGDPIAVEGMRHAAVAAVLRERGDDTEVLLIRRAEVDGDPWSGHMAFPGGRQHGDDADLLATAIRETREEVGLSLESAQLVGRLAPIPAFARGRATGMFVAPFVFEAPLDPVLSLAAAEVKEALWAPLGPMLAGQRDTVIEWQRDDAPLTLPAWDIEGRIVWGLTHRMLSDLFDVLRR